jgi:hypothetical protein
MWKMVANSTVHNSYFSKIFDFMLQSVNLGHKMDILKDPCTINAICEGLNQASN